MIVLLNFVFMDAFGDGGVNSGQVCRDCLRIIHIYA